MRTTTSWIAWRRYVNSPTLIDVDAALDEIVADDEQRTQCRTCKTIAEYPVVRDFINRGTERGLSRPQIMRAVLNNVGVELSEDSLRAHQRKGHE